MQKRKWLACLLGTSEWRQLTVCCIQYQYKHTHIHTHAHHTEVCTKMRKLCDLIGFLYRTKQRCGRNCKFALCTRTHTHLHRHMVYTVVYIYICSYLRNDHDMRFWRTEVSLNYCKGFNYCCQKYLLLVKKNE